MGEGHAEGNVTLCSEWELGGGGGGGGGEEVGGGEELTSQGERLFVLSDLMGGTNHKERGLRVSGKDELGIDRSKGGEWESKVSY